MSRRLTDKQKKKIIADYAELDSYTAVARKNKVAVNTVKRLVNKNPELNKLFKEKQAENSVEILKYMDTKKDVVCAIINDYLTALRDPEKIKKATTVQLSTTMGTLIDKFALQNKYPDLVQNKAEDDPITKTLKEEADNGSL